MQWVLWSLLVPLVSGDGTRLGAVPVESLILDRLEIANRPDGRAAAVIVDHGRFGGSSLFLVEGGTAMLLHRTRTGEELASPVWSPDGSRLAFVQALPSRRLCLGGIPRLQREGRVWLWEGGRSVPLSACAQVSRVLAWRPDDRLVIALAEPGDLPEERPALLDLPSGGVRDLLPRFQGHLYSLTLQDDRLLFASTRAPVTTLPAPGQEVEIGSATLDGRADVLARERGRLPVDLRLEGDRLRYRIDGRSEAAVLDLRSGAI